jgi:glycine/D-amino acid oxidase-like deaminating enzyme
VIGLATALAAQDRGARVTVLEAEAPGAEGSAGPGRIFRHIHDLDELVPLAAAARRGWDEAGERFGRRLVDDRGALLIGGPRDRYAASLAAAGIAHALLEPDDLPPQLAPLGRGLLDPGGGTIDAEGYIEALAQELADRIEFAPAREVLDEPGGPAVVTDHRRIDAGAVLISAGAATAELAAPLGLAPPLATSEHRRVTFDGTSGDGLPCVLERSRTEPMTGYLTPLPGGGVSLGTGAADDLPDDDAVALTAAYLTAIIPGADLAPTAAVRCRSVVLAGHTEALGLYRAGGVAAFAGGNLFKHAPALGPLVAEALLEGRVDPLLTPP